jgi:hypothetical protein
VTAVSAVCPVTVYQSREEVETALIDHLQTYVFGEPALAMVVGQLRSEIEAQIPQRDADVAALEAELASVRAEQKRLAKAVALADDVPELVTELQQRSARIQNLEGQLIAAKRTRPSSPHSWTESKRTPGRTSRRCAGRSPIRPISGTSSWPCSRTA